MVVQTELSFEFFFFNYIRFLFDFIFFGIVFFFPLKIENNINYILEFI